MYINVPLLQSRELSLEEFSLLSIIRQNKKEDLGEYLQGSLKETSYDRFFELKLIEEIKTGKTRFERLRLSKKGQSWLDEIETPEITENDLTIYEWLASVYVETGREVGNAKKAKTFISLFRAQSGIEKKSLALLCKMFIEDDSQFEWSKKLEFLFFKPPNVFSVKFDLQQSRLYQYYLNKQNYFDNQFKRFDQ